MKLKPSQTTLRPASSLATTAAGRIARRQATQQATGPPSRAVCAFRRGHRFADPSRVRCHQNRLEALRERDQLEQLRQPRQMKLPLLEPEHEEEMRRPSVEPGEVHSLPRPPENHEGTDDLVRMAVQGVQKRNAVSGGAGQDVLALDQAADEPSPVTHY